MAQKAVSFCPQRWSLFFINPDQQLQERWKVNPPSLIYIVAVALRKITTI